MKIPIPMGGWLDSVQAQRLQKLCSAGQWRDGILARPTGSTLLIPNIPNYVEGIAPDGAGGAFILTYSLIQDYNRGPYALCHIDASGSLTASIPFGDPLWWLGTYGAFSAGAIVSSGHGRCIVVRANDWARVGFSAQRYDIGGASLWGSRPVTVSSQVGSGSAPPCNLIAEPDGSEGCIAAWYGPWTFPAPIPIWCQRLDSRGKVLWGPDGIQVGEIAPGPKTHAGPWMAADLSWVQLVPDGDGGAIIVWAQPEPGIRPQRFDTTYVAVAISKAGTPRQGPVTLATTPTNGWVADQRLRRAISDGAGGLFLAVADAMGDLRCLRYSPASGVVWERTFGHPLHPMCFQISEDGSGGALLSFMSSTPQPRLELKRIDRAGNVIWDINASSPIPILVQLPPASNNWGNFFIWANLTQAVPDGAGGAIAVYQDAPQTKMKLFTVCFDSHGARRSAVQPVSGRSGNQESPMLSAVTGGNAVVGWTDDAVGAGAEVWAQRVGCCPLPESGDSLQPQFPCAITETPGLPYGQFSVDFPCGDRDRQVGVLPLSLLPARIPSLDCPGCLTNRAAPAPDWMRITLVGLPRDIDVTLQRTNGKVVARPSAIRGAHDAQFLRVLTFRPLARNDFLLVFAHRGDLKPGSRFTVRVRTAWGNAEPPSLPRRIGKKRPTRRPPGRPGRTGKKIAAKKPKRDQRRT